MTRIVAIGVIAIVLAACQQAPEPAVPAAVVAQTAAGDQAAQDAVWAALEERYLGMEAVPSDPIEAL